ncbi:MAG: hypothetical protein AAGJ81_16215 [Verrucomicrobiota bacterium]
MIKEKTIENSRPWPPPVDYAGLQVSVEREDGMRTWANRYGRGLWHLREESDSPAVRWWPSREINGMTV